MEIRRVVIGSDHAGLELKEDLKSYLEGKGFSVTDVGPVTRDCVDYPDYAESVSQRIVHGDADLGVLVCGTGLGMVMAANKVPGIRAALLYNDVAARYARLHNDANVIVFGGRTMSPDESRRYLDVFMAEKFEGGRHRGRLKKIKRLEERNKRPTGGN